MCYQSINLETISARKLRRSGEQLVCYSVWVWDIIRWRTCQYCSLSDFLSCGREGVDAGARFAIIEDLIVMGKALATMLILMPVVEKLMPIPITNKRPRWHNGAMGLSVGDVAERCNVFFLATRD
jgi:hypothetical protein